MSKYADIIAKLEAATGPSRELDVLAYVACGFGLVEEQHGKHFKLLRSDGRRSLHVFIGEEKGPYQPNEAEDVSGMVGWDVFTVPPFTSSLDAAIALVERMLPGAEFELTAIYNIAQARLPLNGPDEFHGRSETGSLPIAILLAMFRALEAEAKL